MHAGRLRILLWLVVALVGITACGGSNEPSADSVSHSAVPITAGTPTIRDLEVVETAIGQLEASNAPTIAAEVPGRIQQVAVDVGYSVAQGELLASIDPIDFKLNRASAQADIERLKALIRAQGLQVRRLRTLVAKQSFNQSALDEAQAQLGALDAQLAAARVQLQRASRDLEKSRIVSPVAGKLDERRVSVGDYVAVGTPLFHVTSPAKLQARLPFPEALGDVLRTGLAVRLTTPTAPNARVTGTISQIRPVITPENRALVVIVDLDNPGGWEPGASVSGTVVVAHREHAVLVPEVSVVRRPAGVVVYVIEEGLAIARPVRTGIRRDGLVEIVSGLEGDERIAVDGAAFLTDGVAVDLS